MRALVVDDDILFCSIVTKTLKSIGYEVVELYNGKDAIKELQNSKFDIVITDIVMPGENGIAVGEYIKSNKLCCAVMAISSDSSENGILNFAEYYVDCTLTKPFDKNQFLYTLNSLVKGVNVDSALQNI